MPRCLIDELHVNPSLIGVTARQRVMDYKKLSRIRPAVAAALRLSPAPLQGFEFEATFILNTALFNMVQALPVLPGPCQLLRWSRSSSRWLSGITHEGRREERLSHCGSDPPR